MRPMTRTTETSKSPKNLKKPDDRSARLAAALRANLRRRKQQERGRGEAEQNKPTTAKDQGR
jgi:hypothetical protein